MTGPQLKAWRAHWNLSQPQLGEFLGLTVESVSRWERGSVPVPTWLPLALETIERHQMADFRRRSKGSGLVGTIKAGPDEIDQPAHEPRPELA